tara:strand:+ start:427 stop:663 length:237 start_codon:yes stop_codon:yes gene_type:complete
MKTVKITCIPEIESDEAITTADVTLTLNKMDSYAVAARVINSFRDWSSIYKLVSASDVFDLIKSGGGKISGSEVSIID